VVPVKGRKPAGLGVSNNRHAPTHDWAEVENVPFEDGPELPDFRSDGRPWPDATKAKWQAWRSMPHCKLWGDSEWSYARDAIELAASFHLTAEPKFATELRNREKVLGTTRDYLRDLRIRYIEPRDDNEVPAGVTRIHDFRNL
jgi:hypothetical protein